MPYDLKQPLLSTEIKEIEYSFTTKSKGGSTKVHVIFVTLTGDKNCALMTIEN